MQNGFAICENVRWVGHLLMIMMVARKLPFLTGSQSDGGCSWGIGYNIIFIFSIIFVIVVIIIITSSLLMLTQMSS